MGPRKLVETAAIPAEKPPGPKRRLKSLRELDRRTSAAKAAFALRASIIEDLGGEGELSSMKLAIIGNVAILGAALEDLAVSFLAGKDTDMAGFATLANSQRRLLADLGLDRKAGEVPHDLKAYIAQRRPPEPQVIDAEEQAAP